MWKLLFFSLFLNIILSVPFFLKIQSIDIWFFLRSKNRCFSPFVRLIQNENLSCYIWKMLNSSQKSHESLVQYFSCSDWIVKQFLSTHWTEWCNLGVRKSGYDDTKEEFRALYELIDLRWPWPLNVDVKSAGSIIPIRLGSFSVFNYT